MDDVISHQWLLVKPPDACQYAYLVRMEEKTAATAMSENLKALGKAREGLRTQLQVAKRAGVGEGTVSRARRGDGNTTLSNLESIAKAFRLEAWQLIKPGFPVKPESGAPSEADANALLVLYSALQPEGRANLMSIATTLYNAQVRQAGVAARASLLSDPEVREAMGRAPLPKDETDVSKMPQERNLRSPLRDADRHGGMGKGQAGGETNAAKDDRRKLTHRSEKISPSVWARCC